MRVLPRLGGRLREGLGKVKCGGVRGVVVRYEGIFGE